MPSSIEFAAVPDHGHQTPLLKYYTVPESYADKLTELFPGTFVSLKLFALDLYDLALSKLERNIDRDREDMLLLAHTTAFDVDVLKSDT